METAYAPPVGYALQHQGSDLSQQGLLVNPGLVNGDQGLVNGYHRSPHAAGQQPNNQANMAFRHQRQTDNPFVDERWPFIPMAAETKAVGHIPYATGQYEHLPYSSHERPAIGQLARARSDVSRQGSAGLFNFGSGDQYFTAAQHLSHAQPGMVQQASSPRPAPGRASIGPATPWAPAVVASQWSSAAANSAASGNSLVMHGTHSLLERPGPGHLVCLHPVSTAY